MYSYLSNQGKSLDERIRDIAVSHFEAAQDAYYNSPEYQAEQEAILEAWGRETQAQEQLTNGDLFLALEEKAASEGNYEYLESLNSTLEPEAQA